MALATTIREIQAGICRILGEWDGRGKQD